MTHQQSEPPVKAVNMLSSTFNLGEFFKQLNKELAQIVKPVERAGLAASLTRREMDAVDRSSETVRRAMRENFGCDAKRYSAAVTLFRTYLSQPPEPGDSRGPLAEEFKPTLRLLGLYHE